MACTQPARSVQNRVHPTFVAKQTDVVLNVSVGLGKTHYRSIWVTPPVPDGHSVLLTNDGPQVAVEFALEPAGGLGRRRVYEPWPSSNGQARRRLAVPDHHPALPAGANDDRHQPPVQAVRRRTDLCNPRSRLHQRPTIVIADGAPAGLIPLRSLSHRSPVSPSCADRRKAGIGLSALVTMHNRPICATCERLRKEMSA